MRRKTPSGSEFPASAMLPLQGALGWPLFSVFMVGACVLGGAFGFGLGKWFGAFYTTIFEQAAILIVVLVGFDFLAGVLDRVSLGHNGFWALGAYTLIIGTQKGLGIWPAILLAIAICAALGFGMGFVTRNMAGYYFAMLTLGFGICVLSIVQVFPSLTNGDSGLTALPQDSLASLGVAPITAVTGAWAIAAGVVAFGWIVMRQRLGRVLTLVRHSPVAAEASGVRVGNVRIFVFVSSAILACLGGVAYAYMTGFIAPGSVDLSLTTSFLIALFVGGSGTVIGVVPGALFVVLLPTWLGSTGTLFPLVEGAILVAILLFLPGGLVGTIQRFAKGRPFGSGLSSGHPFDGTRRAVLTAAQRVLRHEKEPLIMGERVDG